jgi:hypothetical protein
MSVRKKRVALRASVETVADLLAFLPVFFRTDESNVQAIERFGMPPPPLVELSESDPQKVRNS